MVVLYLLHALQTSYGNVSIRSPSGDTNILVIAIGLITQTSRVFVGSGNGNIRRRTWLHSIHVNENQCKTLIGCNVFSGNDYLSAFFRKGKQLFWKKIPRRKAFYPVSSKLEVVEIYHTIFDQELKSLLVNSTHQTSQVLMKWVFRILRKSNSCQSRSSISPSYSLSEYVDATLDQSLLCGKVVETPRNSFSQLTFTLKTWMEQRWRNTVDCGSVPRRCQKPSRKQWPPWWWTQRWTRGWGT